MTTARQQLLFDLFTTALEGGIGYWSECSAYRWEEATNDSATMELVHPDRYFALIVETDDDERARLRIDQRTLSVGYARATTGWRDKVSWSSGEKPPLVITDDTDWDFDASDADVIVQLGLFNEVRYG